MNKAKTPETGSFMEHLTKTATTVAIGAVAVMAGVDLLLGPQ